MSEDAFTFIPFELTPFEQEFLEYMQFVQVCWGVTLKDLGFVEDTTNYRATVHLLQLDEDQRGKPDDNLP